VSKNYFSIERNGQCLDKVILKFNDDVAFEDLMDMSYEEMKSYPEIEEFIVAVMETTSDLGGTQVIVNLVGSDEIFIWGIIIGVYNDDYNFVFVDWQKDGMKYRYTED
jgi:hypothetical protein